MSVYSGKFRAYALLLLVLFHISFGNLSPFQPVYVISSTKRLRSGDSNAFSPQTEESVLNVKFQAYEEDYDFEVHADNSIWNNAHITVMGDTGIQAVEAPTNIFVSEFQGPHGLTKASFIIEDGEIIDGAVHTSSESFDLRPAASIERDLLEYADLSKSTRKTIKMLKKFDKKQLLAFKAHEIMPVDEQGKSPFQCTHLKKEDMKHSNPSTTTSTSTTTRSISASTARELALVRWSNCHSQSPYLGYYMNVDFVVDVTASKLWSRSSTVNPTLVLAELTRLVVRVNHVYGAQLAVQIRPFTVDIRAVQTTEAWNRDIVTIDIYKYLDAIEVYRRNQAGNKKGAVLHAFTNSYKSGTVGVAYVSALRDTVQSIGVNSGLSNTGSFMTFAHELGHSMGAGHAFDHPKYTEYGSSGGIMDYNDKALSSFHDSPYEMAFSNLFDKQDICTHLRAAIATRDSSAIPFSQSFQVISTSSTCGNSVVDEGEECDTGSDTACCVACKFVTGATCATPGQCCVSCKAQLATTICSDNNSYCGASGFCETPTISSRSDFTFTGVNGCKELVRRNTGATGSLNIGNLFLCQPNGGNPVGYCSNGACSASTYAWKQSIAGCNVGISTVNSEYKCRQTGTGLVVSSSLCSGTKPASSTVFCNVTEDMPVIATTPTKKKDDKVNVVVIIVVIAVVILIIAGICYVCRRKNKQKQQQQLHEQQQQQQRQHQHEQQQATAYNTSDSNTSNRVYPTNNIELADHNNSYNRNNNYNQPLPQPQPYVGNGGNPYATQQPLQPQYTSRQPQYPPAPQNNYPPQQQSSYNNPHNPYNNQQSSYNNQQNSYNNPQNSYNNPQNSYNNPQNSYNNPQNAYSSPQNAATAQNQNAPPPPVYAHNESQYMDPPPAYQPQNSTGPSAPSQNHL